MYQNRIVCIKEEDWLQQDRDYFMLGYMEEGGYLSLKITPLASVLFL